MPTYDFTCFNRNCENYGRKTWKFLHSYRSPDPVCRCGRRLKRLPAAPAIVFTGPLTAKYNDPKKEGSHEEGHWAWRVRSTTRPDGKPEPVFIDTFEKQRKFCKEEGLINPAEMPRHLEISEDGRSFKSTSGYPGQWI